MLACCLLIWGILVASSFLGVLLYWHLMTNIFHKAYWNFEMLLGSMQVKLAGSICRIYVTPNQSSHYWSSQYAGVILLLSHVHSLCLGLCLPHHGESDLFPVYWCSVTHAEWKKEWVLGDHGCTWGNLSVSFAQVWFTPLTFSGLIQLGKSIFLHFWSPGVRSAGPVASGDLSP